MGLNLILKWDGDTFQHLTMLSLSCFWRVSEFRHTWPEVLKQKSGKWDWGHYSPDSSSREELWAGEVRVGGGESQRVEYIFSSFSVLCSSPRWAVSNRLFCPHLSALARSLSLRIFAIPLHCAHFFYCLYTRAAAKWRHGQMLQGVSLEFEIDEIQVSPHPCSKMVDVYFCPCFCLWNTYCTGNGKGRRRRPNEHYYLYFLPRSPRSLLPSYLLLSCPLSLSLPLSPQILISKFMATGRPYGSPDADGGCPAIALALDQLGTCKYCRTGYR